MSMMYMSPPAGPSLVAPGHTQQPHAHAHAQSQQVHQATSSASFQEWLKAWKSWAGTRKRGKMAQFIVQKLEENVSKKGGRSRCICTYIARSFSYAVACGRGIYSTCTTYKMVCSFLKVMSHYFMHFLKFPL